MAQSLWSWEAAQFEKLEASNAMTSHSGESWHVLINKSNRAWGYRIPLPNEARMFIMWNSTLEVTKVDSGVHPGLAYFYGGDGIALQLDMDAKKSELRHVTHTMETKCIAVYRAPDIQPPFSISLSLNAVTKVCVGTVNGARVFHIKLPYRTLPAFDEISDLEILTTTPPQSDGGAACYGALTLQCE